MASPTVPPALSPIAPPPVGDMIQQMRKERGMTLETLSRASGVSKSMLSQIERDKANPTIAVAWRLANALGVRLDQLLGAPSGDPEPVRVFGKHETPTLAGAEHAYTLKILGPMELAGKYEWYELTLQPGAALVSEPHDPGTREHFTVFDGQVDIEVDHFARRARPGETARYPADRAHAIRNAGKSVARGLLVVIHG
ncbi:helix-turn-helix transcriptional regulator [Pandoraea nosoerga]|uniref:DNA-binding protein n=1 Tax=Pandoraea nosoerga TaxID=2508296 RepID=A0A5E4TE82_9BURK|nr:MULTISPECIES: XRE family transcriptional regulator [Pandoraea]MBN4664197.1 helix-turn-helix transcriptional regulator [Pandoraea nosoerga]MBN4675394.1 helix-turn-helix transcriptional regulator [Pandoraea nosoerga]MBN4679284.1 helix-turn-helix transcriptional regulator [Pandoraea nosoerga]MBN4743718.1 helix-turn-helix transcriptional regulator [Pandoraea nosoerga]VVD84429.1 DNA-binding protein [Pandoraea nosoerga]